MLVTEREAALLRCTPIATAILSLPETTERNRALVSVGASCIGSRCMQWRFRTPAPAEPGNTHQNGDRRGYCGLAGSISPTI